MSLSPALAAGPEVRTQTTGLRPLTALDERLAAARAVHPNPRHALAVFSIDQFPGMREQFGPHIWEQAVAVVARLLTEAMGPKDVAARYGEHRLAVLVADGGPDAVESIAERVRAGLAAADRNASLPMALTVSVRVAPTAGTVAASIAEADSPAGSTRPGPAHGAPKPGVPALMPARCGRDIILIVEDEPALLALARETLLPTGADILCTERAQEALEYLQSGKIDVVVTDIHLPDISGLDLLKRIRLADPGVVVIMITGSRDLGLAIHAIRGGADDYLVKPFSPHDLRDSVSRALTKRQLILGSKAYQAMLESQVQQRTQEFAQVIRHLEATYRATLKALGAALDTRDVETHAHSERVAQYALTLGRLLDMSEPELVTLERGVYLHDVGKIGIPDRVLLKQDKLTDEEWEIMRRHSQLGFRLASRIDFLKGASKIILTHHERYDGSGYPYGLKGDAIPFGARIFAIVDTLDAMTSDRPYRKARPFSHAREEIGRYSGRQFDPRIVDAFLSVPGHTWSDIRESVNSQASAEIDVSDDGLLDAGRKALL